MLKKEESPLNKVILLYVVYFLYTMLGSMLASKLNISNSAYIMMPADILFLVFSVVMYKNNLKNDFQKFKRTKILKTIGTIVLGIVSIIILNGIMGVLTDFFLPDVNMDSNTSAMLTLLRTSPIYAFFKVLIFATIAEEILFRESISTCVKDNILFIIFSALIYTMMNFIFNSSTLTLVDLLVYFVPALLFSFIYIKNDRNIIIVMIIKFIMQFIPFIMLLVK